MKRIFTFMAALMIAATAFGQDYGILVNGTDLFNAEAAGTTQEGHQQYLAHIAMGPGYTFQLYDVQNQVAWAVPLDEYSLSAFSLVDDNYYACDSAGCYDFYIKLKYGADQLYIGEGSNCFNNIDPEPVEQEDDLTLCMTDQQLYAYSTEALSFSLYDADGNLVNMVYAGSDDDGGVRYDMSGLATGRYTLVVNDDSYIFDHNLPLQIYFGKQEGSNCTSYYVYSEAYVDSGQVYLYNCSRMTEPGLVQWDGLSIDNCDSTVVFNLMYNLDNPQEEEGPRSLTITAESSSGATDVLYLYEDPDYSSSFDNGYDVAKMMNTGANAINLYTNVEGTAVSTLATNDLTNIELVFEGTETDTSYTFTFTNVSGTITLYDRYNGEETLLGEEDTYTFSDEPTQDISSRFVINYVAKYYIGLMADATGAIEWYQMTEGADDGTWEYTAEYPGGGVYVNTMPQTNELMQWISEDDWLYTSVTTPQVGDTLTFTWNPAASTMTVTLIYSQPQPQEEERRICLSHKKLMITELNNSNPILLDSTGMQIEMVIEGYPMQNAIQYDLTNLPAGRYNLVIDTTSLIFDIGTETTTSYTQEGQDCLTYNTVINATIEPGQTYLFICSQKTEPGRYGSILSNMTDCDSLVILNLSFVEEDTTCFNDTLLIEAVICEGESFTWRGEEFTDPGTYELTVQQHGGCDSVFIINLSVNPTYHIEEIVSVREDRLPYIWHEQEITESGQYFAELSTLAGCDSIITLHLTVTELPIYSVTAIADHGFVNGTGTYPEGTTIHLEAVADEGFEFQMWSDGTTVNPKDFVVMQDTTLRALFYMPEVEQEVTIDSIETNSVTIIWDTVAGAVLYELRIYKNGQLVVTYQVDRDNNIISELFAGPDRLIARRDSTGGSSETLQVNVGGLDPGQDYTYSLDAMDDDRSYVGAQSGSFTTEEEQLEGLDTLFDNRRNAPRKLIENGRLYIEMPDGSRYDACGVRLE